MWIIERKDLLTGDVLPNYLARSIPNEPLKVIFSIDNIFTTTNSKRAADFKRHAVLTVRAAVENVDREEDWNPLIAHMRSAVRKELGRSEGRIRLADLVQFVTLNVSFMYLFPYEVEPWQVNRCDKDVKFIAKRTNELWMESIGCPSEGLPDWRNESDMHGDLNYVLMVDPKKPETNPMNLILPAYETLWRAVLRGVVEIYFRNRKDQDPSRWKLLLKNYLKKPTPAKWKFEDHEFYLSTLDIVKEILRLYPPTRRIKRKYPGETIIKEADLEEMHRNPRLAGNDPERFRPERWVKIKKDFATKTGFDFERPGEPRNRQPRVSNLQDYEEEILGFMPFARVCPAGKETTRAFGWKMIALLVATLIEGLQELDGNWTLRAEEAEDELPSIGKALKSGRHDYLTLVYEKNN